LIRDLENLKNKLKTIETNTKSTELSQINGNKKNDTKEKLGEFSDHPHLSLIKKKKIYETTNLISNQLSNVVTNLNSLASSLYLSSAITHKVCFSYFISIIFTLVFNFYRIFNSYQK
jgi:hypothetical protein